MGYGGLLISPETGLDACGKSPALEMKAKLTKLALVQMGITGICASLVRTTGQELPRTLAVNAQKK